MTIVETQSLSRRFGRRWAYANIDLMVEKGERLLLIGANGSGKTTLLRTIATLLPPSQGQLKLFGESISGKTSHLRKKIGYVSHETGLYTDLSALENLRVYSKLMGRGYSQKEMEEILQRVGLSMRTDPVRTYSAGMKKRASIALLLLKNPELVLLDEPFSALDPKGVEEIGQLILDMEATVIIASHQVESAARLCHRSMLLENGMIRWKGGAEKAWKAWRAAQRESR